MLARRGVGDDFNEVLERGIRPYATDRCVDVQTTRQIRSALIAICARNANHLQKPLVDSCADTRDLRRIVCAPEQVPVDRRHDAEVARVRKRGIENVQFLLAEAIYAKRLLVRTGRQPVIEDTHTPSKSGIAAGEGGPRRSEARSEIAMVTDMCLCFKTYAWTERQILPRPNVVLYVH